jgi:hypothetical protein
MTGTVSLTPRRTDSLMTARLLATIRATADLPQGERMGLLRAALDQG